ncbi:MAG: type IV pilus biogenesis/stability protein PilW [Zoogloeaceae bacterium]|jgi:type IV pilus assembly protein PilF|nr:type IV pilus biogenesis/stability protein PilW [Zoogloeaceae bacterium]
MMKKFTRLLVCLGGLAALPVWAQVVIPQSNPSTATVSDARERARLHTELGSLYFQAGNEAVALEEIGIALEADASYASAYSVRGLVNASLRQYPEAEADFKKALSLAPGDPDVSNNYGWYLCQQGRETESIAYFLVAVKNPLYRTPDMAYTNAGTCALRAGDREGARAYLSRALGFVGGNSAPVAQLQLAKLAYLENSLTEARNRLMEVMQAISQPPAEALWLGIRIERKLGNKSDEASMAAQLRRRYPASNEYQEFLKGHYD